MINKVQLIGNTGAAPEVREVNGNKVASFSLATSEEYKNKAGEKVKETQWHNISVWGKLADIVEKYVKKGDKIYLDGKIVYRSWEKDGVKKYATDIVCNNMKMLGGNTAGVTEPVNNDVGAEPNDLPF